MATFIIEFECTDDTGRYISPVICQRRGDRLVIYYMDFPDIIQICHHTAKTSVIKNMIRFLFTQEGVIPRVKFYKAEEVDIEKIPAF